MTQVSQRRRPCKIIIFAAVAVAILTINNNETYFLLLMDAVFGVDSCGTLELLSSSTAANDYARGILDSLKDSYDELPEAGKFATGAVAGFGVTRFTVNKVVTVVKLAGAAFIGYVLNE